MGFLQTALSLGTEAAVALKNNKEKILLVGGLVLGVATVGSTVRCTLKCKDIVDEWKTNVETIHTAAELSEEYSDSDDMHKDFVKASVYAGVGMAKEIAVPVIFGAGATACIIAQHCMMERKVEKLTETVVGLAAAYKTIDLAFKNYRKNVINELGKEADDRFRHGVKKDEGATVIEFDENGNEKVSKKDIYYTDESDPSDYAKFYCGVNSDGSLNPQFVWMDPLKTRADWDANIHFLNCQQSYANQLLRINGYLFLNDVYEMLGLPKTKAGQVVGWIFDPENPNIDSHISFGTFRIINRKVINHEGGYEYEECILLDFNVDGVIIDKVKIFEK